jgi:hypothetical protein
MEFKVGDILRTKEDMSIYNWDRTKEPHLILRVNDMDIRGFSEEEYYLCSILNRKKDGIRGKFSDTDNWVFNPEEVELYTAKVWDDYAIYDYSIGDVVKVKSFGGLLERTIRRFINHEEAEVELTDEGLMRITRDGLDTVRVSDLIKVEDEAYNDFSERVLAIGNNFFDDREKAFGCFMIDEESSCFGCEFEEEEEPAKIVLIQAKDLGTYYSILEELQDDGFCWGSGAELLGELSFRYWEEGNRGNCENLVLHVNSDPKEVLRPFSTSEYPSFEVLETLEEVVEYLDMVQDTKEEGVFY